MRLIVIKLCFWMIYGLLPKTWSSEAPNITTSADARLRRRWCKESRSQCQGWDCCEGHWCVLTKHGSYCEPIANCSKNEEEAPCYEFNVPCVPNNPNYFPCCPDLICKKPFQSQWSIHRCVPSS